MKQGFKFLAVILLMTAVFSNSYSQQDVNGWYWLQKPQGQTINWMKVFDATNIFAVTSRGIFMKSSDGGDSWSLSQAGALDLSSTGGLARRDLLTGWFFDASTGIVAGAAQTGTPSKTVVQKTTDGGTTWSTKIVNNTAGGSVNGIYFINSTTGFLCGGTNALVYKTTDQGETWTALTGMPSTTYYAIHAFDENNLIIGAGSRRLVRTTNGGTSWIIDTIFTAATNVQFLGIKFRDANTGYVIGNPNYFAYTTNGGANWTASTHSSIRGQRALDYNMGTVWTAGDYEYVYKSTNDGVTWDSVKFYDLSNPNQPTPFIIYAFAANGNDMVVGGSLGQLTTSNDAGATWRNKNYLVNPTYSLYGAMYAESTNGRLMVGCTNGSTILHSTNGGTNWTSVNNGFVNSVSAVYSFDFISSTTGYAAGGRATAGVGEMSRTTDGGATWTIMTLPSPASTYQINDVDFIDANTGWLSGFAGAFAPHLIMKTTDGGATWTQQYLQGNPALTGAVISVQMVNANTGYCLASAGFHWTTDGGATWTKNTNPYLTGVGNSNMVVINKDVVVLHGSGVSGTKLVNRTTDGGNTWADISGNLLTTATIFKSQWLNMNDGVVSGTNGFMGITTNGGVTWAQSNPGFSTTVDVQFPAKSTWFTISDRNGQYQIGRKLETNNTITVNPVIGIEGFWNGSTQVADTVTLELRNSTSPYALVASKKAVITPGIGYGTFEYSSVGAGSYYVVVKHRNTIETWSASPIAMTPGGNYNYDFTTAATQAYGSNMVLKLGRHCIYSGDTDQDGSVDATDFSQVDNDAFNFVSGYVATDVTGDNSVDASDAAIVDNNAFNFVQKITP